MSPVNGTNYLSEFSQGKGVELMLPSLHRGGWKGGSLAGSRGSGDPLLATGGLQAGTEGQYGGGRDART